MSIICKIFGHRVPDGYFGSNDAPYVIIEGRGIDGIGRNHGVIHQHCGRCNKRFVVARVHRKGCIEVRKEKENANRSSDI